MSSNIWARNGGVYLGFACSNTEGPPEDCQARPIQYVGDRHIFLCGPNGSGKSRRALLPNLMNLTAWSQVVIDIKGELAFWSAEHRRKAGNEIIHLNPFKVLDLPSTGFNPVAALDPEVDFVDDALGLAEAIIREEGREPHWSASAQDLLCALIMYSRLTGPNGGSLGHVRELLGKPSLALDASQAYLLASAVAVRLKRIHRDSLGFLASAVAVRLKRIHRDSLGFADKPAEKPTLPYFMAPPSTATFRWKFILRPRRVEDVKAMMKTGIERGHEELSIKAARFRDITPESRELNAILSTAMTQTRWLDSRPVKADLARGTFDFSVLKERPVTIYLSLPGNRLGTHSPWLRLMLTAIVQKLLKDARPSKVPVLLMLDEAAQLHDPPIIRHSMAIMRGYGIKLLSVYQDVPQAKLVLGDRFESYTANAGVLQTFQAQDVTTAKFFSERSGERNADVLSYSAPVDQLTGIPEGGSLSFSQDKLPGILPQRIINMDQGYSVLFTHKTKGLVRSFLPDPSSMRGFEHVANRAPG